MSNMSIMVMPGCAVMFKVNLISVKTKKFVLQDPITGDVLTAHDNCKHVYWSYIDEPGTWEHFTFDEHKRLVSSHDTCVWYDAETEKIWQYHQQHDSMEGSLYISGEVVGEGEEESESDEEFEGEDEGEAEDEAAAYDESWT